MVFENCFPPIVAEELVFHVKPENSRKFFLTVGGMRFDFSIGHNAKLEVYSAAGEMGFGWWLVEHYLSYHVNCPDGCDSGESTRGRKDSPYFQMSYGSLDHIADLVDPFVESFLPA